VIWLELRLSDARSRLEDVERRLGPEARVGSVPPDPPPQQAGEGVAR
jgi:hypothetical protein